MKMSDVFKDYELEYWGAFSAALEADIKYGSKFQAAMYATANHDALVELNKELVEALETIIKTAFLPPRDCEEAFELIRKAKELTND